MALCGSREYCADLVADLDNISLDSVDGGGKEDSRARKQRKNSEDKFDHGERVSPPWRKGWSDLWSLNLYESSISGG